MPLPLSPHISLEVIIREDWGRLLASLTATYRDLQLAEDSLQDAVEMALKNWSKTGLPDSPAAWLLTVARRKALDRIRRNTHIKNHAKAPSDDDPVWAEEDTLSLATIPDERLALIFTCCHPTLAPKTKVALTLSAIGGLTTPEIAQAFLDKPETIAQRLVRAKRKIKTAHIPFDVPTQKALPERLQDVLNVIYLIFNEGYAPRTGSAVTRIDLSDEAIRMARILSGLLPENCEVDGLLALMLLHASRRQSRQNTDGEMIALEHQNRTRWNPFKIKEGQKILQRALLKKQIGPFQIQACISALHAEAATWAQTDWPQISALYALLYHMQPNPVIRLNRAVAISYAQNVTTALAYLKEGDCESELINYRPYHAVLADFMKRLGKTKAAHDCYSRAIALCDNDAERDFLIGQKNDLKSE